MFHAGKRQECTYLVGKITTPTCFSTFFEQLNTLKTYVEYTL